MATRRAPELTDEQVDEWVRQQLQRAPGRLSERQRRVIRQALESAAVGTDQHHDPGPEPAPTRAAG